VKSVNEGRALSGARPIPGFSPFLSIPGGVVLGFGTGIGFGVITVATNSFADPTRALSGIGGLLLHGVVIGAVAGAASGLIIGSLVAIVVSLVLLVVQRILIPAVVGGVVTTLSIMAGLGAAGIEISEIAVLAVWAGVEAGGGLTVVLWFTPAWRRNDHSS
jgi:hypothetical protein